MANTINVGMGVVHVIMDGDHAFTMITTTGGPWIRLKSIQYIGTAVNTTGFVYDGIASSSAKIFEKTDALAAGVQVVYSSLVCRPFVGSGNALSEFIFEYE